MEVSRMRFRSLLTHSGQALLEGAIIASLAVGLIAGTTLAAKGGGNPPTGGGGGLALKMVLDRNGDGAPNWADQITFVVPAGSQYPVVSVTCAQNGVTVYGDSRPMYWPNPFADPGTFGLSSQAWTGGAASCQAVLKGTSSRGKTVTLSSLSFIAAA
jgi:hypothetical protein